MKKASLLLLLISGISLKINAQEASSTGILPRKGSYLYYGQPNIEDNSMFIEEAFNQERGVIQHISNFVFTDLEEGNFNYAYTQEIPLAGDKHQFSFTLNYPVLESPLRTGFPSSGFGDLLLNYRPMLMDKNDWALIIPRFTVIVPTGDAQHGFGEGGWGGQFNLAVTKRLNTKIITHYNAGYTFLTKANRYFTDEQGNTTALLERDLHHYNVGASAVYLLSNAFNLMMEYTSTFESDVEEDGAIRRGHFLTLNPGFRCAFSVGKVQIVPGLGVPLFFSEGAFEQGGGFIYLSIEPDYTK